MVPIIIAVLYFGFFSVLFGFMSRRKKATMSEKGDSTFFTASGQIGWIAVMCSFVLAPLGGGHTTSLYENQANIGVSAVWWGIMAGGVFVPIFLYWFGPMFRKLKVQTFPQALGKVFGPKIKIFNSSVAPAAWLGIAMSELLGTSTAVYALCGGKVSYAPGCILIAGALMLIYIFFGGMLQASMMNVINAVVMIVGSFAVVAYVGGAIPGGYEGVAQHYASIGEAFKTDMFSFPPAVVFGTIIPCVVLHVLSVASEHAMYQPMLAAKSNRDIRRGAFLGGLINTAACIPWVVLGVTGTSIAVIAQKAPILSVPELALQVLPPVLIGVLMVALLCALLSTGSGMILAISHVIADDIILPLTGHKQGDKNYKTISRIIIVVVTAAATLPAMKVTLLISLFFWCFALSMPIFVNYLIGMLWKINRKAAWINLIASTAVNFWWTFACPPWAGIFNFAFWPVAVTTIVLGIVLNLILPGEPGLLKQMEEKKAGS
ncbi:MAG: sodium:solute symporter family protein [Lachnospiraceae bacterium]|nr:sodium:solute symporter family protein [Lachnospiraceae bacterium]